MEIGSQLREWRTSRGLSMSEVARRAGVSKGSLSYWESGRHQPRVPELEAVLAALEVSALDRQRLLSLLNAPRAVRSLRRETAGWLPVSGDLLRAIRLRAGRTQAAVAGEINVRQSTLARWENGEAWPEQERLHALLFALGARPEEVAALGAGTVHLRTGNEEADSQESLRAELRSLSDSLWEGEPALIDLRFLSLTSRLWGLARRQPEARLLLVEVLAWQASHLLWLGRAREALSYAERTLAARRNDDPVTPPVLRAVVVSTQAMGRTGGRRAWDEGIRKLAKWLPRTECPSCRVWMLMTAAGGFHRLGRSEEAVELVFQADAVPNPNGGTFGETRESRRWGADVLAIAGRPEAALERLPTDTDCSATQVAMEALSRATALLALGRTSEAQDHLQQACCVPDESLPGDLKQRIDAVAQRL